MTKRIDPAQKLINKFDRSTGNFADNLREMDCEDIASQFGLSIEQSAKVRNHITQKEQANLGPAPGPRLPHQA